MSTKENTPASPGDPDGRGPPRVEIVVRDAALEAKPRGRFGRAFSIGLIGAFLALLVASAAGYNFLPWYHAPETAGITGEKLNGLVQGAATDAIKGFMLTQGIGAAAGFVVFFVMGFLKLGAKK